MRKYCYLRANSTISTKIIMFRKATKEGEGLEQADFKSVCQIAAGTVIDGAVSVKDANMRLDGEINGTVYCAGRLLLSATAKIKGDVTCFELVSEGQIEGQVTAKTQIILAKTAVILGDISCKNLQIEAGALLNGKCTMQRDTPAA